MPRNRVVLVVEDYDPIRSWMVERLASAGYDTLEAADGESGLREATRKGIDLMLLDIVLPKMDGLRVLEAVRKVRPSLPVIIVSARHSEDERVHGLSLGADDYVVKPFSARELLARIDAVLRRTPERPRPILRLSVGKTVVDCARHELTLESGERTVLSNTEIEILEQLAANAGRAVSRAELLTHVWGLTESSAETRAVDMHVTRLRQKLAGKTLTASIDWIVTVRGKGYMLGPGVIVSAPHPS
jgi:DNA-binding response OmpR family regulator